MFHDRFLHPGPRGLIEAVLSQFQPPPPRFSLSLSLPSHANTFTGFPLSLSLSQSLSLPLSPMVIGDADRKRGLTWTWNEYWMPVWQITVVIDTQAKSSQGLQSYFQMAQGRPEVGRPGPWSTRGRGGLQLHTYTPAHTRFCLANCVLDQTWFLHSLWYFFYQMFWLLLIFTISFVSK